MCAVCLFVLCGLASNIELLLGSMNHVTECAAASGPEIPGLEDGEGMDWAVTVHSSKMFKKTSNTIAHDFCCAQERCDCVGRETTEVACREGGTTGFKLIRTAKLVHAIRGQTTYSITLLGQRLDRIGAVWSDRLGWGRIRTSLLL